MEVVMSGTSINDSMEQVVVYLRISEDRTGAEAGVERQRQNCLVRMTPTVPPLLSHSSCA